MSEFVGNIIGIYDAKTAGFVPGSASLHNCMSAHGPEAKIFDKGTNEELNAIRYPDNCMQFMFETMYILKVPSWALEPETQDSNYLDCWRGLEKQFNL